MEALIIGKPNVGKSLFLINFAAYLGARELSLAVTDDDGVIRRRRLPFESARRQLVSPSPQKTAAVQPLECHVAAWTRAKRLLTLVDSPGIPEGIAADPATRRAVAVTLDRLDRSDLIFHILDATAARGQPDPETVDDEIARYAPRLKPYAILANKMDRAPADDGLRVLRARYPGCPVLPVSAVTRQGFREVKAFLLRHWV